MKIAAYKNKVTQIINDQPAATTKWPYKKPFNRDKPHQIEATRASYFVDGGILCERIVAGN